MRVNPNSLLAVLVGFTLNLGLSDVAQAALPAATSHAQAFYSAYVSPGASGELMDTTWSLSDAYGSSVVATATSGPLAKGKGVILTLLMLRIKSAETVASPAQ